MNRGRSIQLGLLLGTVFVVAMVWTGWDTMKHSSGMVAKGMSGSAFSRASASTSARLVVEVLSTGEFGQFRGRLLEERGSSYHVTSVPVDAQLMADAAIVMGGMADIKQHAVLQLSGRFDDHHRVRVTRAVVLTGYVTVEP